ncbi:MAG: LruC domain-containing protein [Candidatus Marinimicrobia bacterium]|nr:LruC domain-containing protein [Candidatus Neomarinimicrobiota bacterium]MBT4362430.1 LruC domain-containing protein [Candidatus Neomarinimicrobiota bacterium]MBT4713413.1 LruC domain-containing protein [Candidatus Neomarinimicrobiota bacterium]MBT4946340.1 LruC domain-containing protein [Candidatus Neomarinimicrobiota bacterium]MBT5312989.1 LruC domain-containing protein [Candidatus Neomarinimicrobiota bacterium]
MDTTNLFRKLALILPSSLLLFTCSNDQLSPELEQVMVPLADREMPADFNYSTKQEVEVDILARNNNGQGLAGVKLTFYAATDDGNEVELFSGVTDSKGLFRRSVQLSASLEEVILKNNYIGLVNEISLPLINNLLRVDYQDLPDAIEDDEDEALGKASLTYTLGYLGSYNQWNGTPNYLESEGDIVSQEFLNDVNTSLPENAPVPSAHPEYLVDGNQINTTMTEDGDVWVTFVHEGAGYKNVLGYYTYPSSSPPLSVNDIDSVTIIFPNVSYQGSGGALHSGDKVYLGYFPTGVEIGWVLISNGWSNGVGNGYRQVYSNPDFNPESVASLRQHNVLLYDEARDLTVLGFEDLDREHGSDDDFNDALFYVTSNPRSAIVNDATVTITYTGDDTDGDGINDPVDDYPNDPTKAYDNFYPAESTFGSLAFEDLWPNKGDYDFNDLVVDYYFTEVLNASNEIVELKADFILKATGATYENGFGFELGITPDQVTSISGSNIFGSAVTLTENGTEANQTKAVCMVFDNVYGIMSRPEGFYVNTQPDAPYVIPDTVSIVISFTQPQLSVNLGTPPYNPFIFVNQDRSREVHLAEHPPTSLVAGSAYFGSGDDASDVSGYYKTYNNLPWALDIVESLTYPLERVTIDEAHNFFIGWAETSGNTYSDWFKDKPGYRTSAKLY